METERIAYRRRAVFPNLTAPRRYSSRASPAYSSRASAAAAAGSWAAYSSARRSRSRDRTLSGTSPLTSPPYLAISFTRLELRKE